MSGTYESMRTSARGRMTMPIHRTDKYASLWVPGPLPGMNEIIAAAKGNGGRGACYARLKREWTEFVWALAKEAGLDKPGPFERCVLTEWTWVERDQRRDPDNFIAGGRKLVLDGLVKAGVLKGDGWKWVGSWRDSWRTVDQVPASKGPGVGVTIIAPEPTVLMMDFKPADLSPLARRLKRRGAP